MYYIFGVIIELFAFIFFTLMILYDKKRIETGFLSTLFNILSAYVFARVDVVSQGSILHLYDSTMVRVSYIFAFVSFIFEVVFIYVYAFSQRD